MRAGYSAEGPLTPRMAQVLQAAASGMTVAETARALHVSQHTVWHERGALFDRLGVDSMPAAVLAAVRRGELQ